MDTDTELKAIRYLLNDLILYVYDLRVKLEELSPSKRKYTMGEPNRTGDSISFDLFTIPKDRYKELVDHYGEDVVNLACVKLDEFIKLNEYIPYRTPYMSLTRRFIKEVLVDRKTIDNSSTVEK
jgi:hypothetical protein